MDFSMSARFQKAWNIRSIRELHGELGFTSNRGRAKIKTVLTEFRDKALSAKGLNPEDFTKWHLSKHQEELHSMAGVFLDKHGEQLWPCDEDPSQSNRLRYPKDQNKIKDLVFKIAGSSEDRESLSGLGAEEQTNQGQLPARDESTNFVQTNEGLAETGSTRETVGTSLPESTAAEQAGTRHDPILPASHGSNLGVEGTPALSNVSNINQHVPEVEFSYGVAIQYPVHLRIPWTPRGHLAFKTLSELEIELKTVLEEGWTRTTGKQDFAGLKDFRIESWHFDVRGHGAILEFDVKRGREKQFEHMKRKVDEHMRLAIMMSPELRPSFDIEIHIVTG